MARMLGRQYPAGPGGVKCQCCGQPPGKARRIRRRAVKRAERAAWKRALSRD